MFLYIWLETNLKVKPFDKQFKNGACLPGHQTWMKAKKRKERISRTKAPYSIDRMLTFSTVILTVILF